MPSLVALLADLYVSVELALVNLALIVRELYRLPADTLPAALVVCVCVCVCVCVITSRYPASS